MIIQGHVPLHRATGVVPSATGFNHAGLVTGMRYAFLHGSRCGLEDVVKTIQLLVAPVIMISANGLICLALYNRLAAIVSRTRTFHKERFDAISNLSALPLEEQTGQRARALRRRGVELELQVKRILRRAKLLRGALMLLMGAVISMLLCSMSLGLTVILESLVWLPLALFFTGTMMMIGASLLALLELAGALEPVMAEGDSVDDGNSV